MFIIREFMALSLVYSATAERLLAYLNLKIGLPRNSVLPFELNTKSLHPQQAVPKSISVRRSGNDRRFAHIHRNRCSLHDGRNEFGTGELDSTIG